jgi:cell division protein FtsB
MDERVVVRRPVGPPPFALRVAAVLSVPLLLYVLVATGQKALENYRLNQQADALRVEIVNLRAQNIQLQKDIERARTDTAIETIAREQLGLIKPGDHAVVVADSTDTRSANAPSPPTRSSSASAGRLAGTDQPSAPPAARPVWREWWDYFFG